MLHRVATPRSTHAVLPMQSSRRWITSIVASPLRVTLAPLRPAVSTAAAAADSSGFTQSFKGLLDAMQSAGLADDLRNAVNANDLSKHKVRNTICGHIHQTVRAQGDIKRALLDLARTRPHYLSAISDATLKSLAAVSLETDERKVRMAQQRLQASYVQGVDLGAKDGGAASLQDVLRLLQCLEGAPDAQPGVLCVLVGAQARRHRGLHGGG